MPAAEATIRTGRPDRYLAQLCKHASKIGGHLRHQPGRHADGTARPEIRHSEWSGADGIVTLNWGQWTMHAAPGSLTVRAEADSEEYLHRIQDLLTTRLERIGRRDHLTVTWQPPAPPGTRPASATTSPAASPAAPAREPPAPPKLPSPCPE